MESEKLKRLYNLAQGFWLSAAGIKARANSIPYKSSRHIEEFDNQEELRSNDNKQS